MIFTCKPHGMSIALYPNSAILGEPFMDPDLSIEQRQPSDQSARDGLFCLKGSVRADFDATVAADAVRIVKSDGFRTRIDGFCRAVLPAFTASSAEIRFDRRPLEEMLSDDSLKAPGTEHQRGQHRQFEPVDRRGIAVDRYRIADETQGF